MSYVIILTLIIEIVKGFEEKTDQQCVRKKWISSAVCGLQRSRQSPEEFGAETSFDRPNAVIAKPRRGCGNPFPRYYRLRLCRKNIEFEFATANSNISKFRRRRNYIEFPRQRKYIDARAGVPPVPISAVSVARTVYSNARSASEPCPPGPLIRLRRTETPKPPSPTGKAVVEAPPKWTASKAGGASPSPLRVWVRSPTIQHRTLLATGNWRLFC